MRSKPWLAVLSAGVLAACQGQGTGSRAPAEEPAASSSQATDNDTGSKGGIGKIVEPLKPEPIILPAGTELPLVFDTTVSSGTSRPGDSVVAKLASDVRAGEKAVLPAGSEVRGKVTSAEGSGRVKGQAHLALVFDTLTYKGKDYPIETHAIDVTAPKQHKKDAKIIGGTAAAGAIIGAIAGGGKGALIGGGVGGAAGTGAVLATKGQEVTLPAGYRRTVAVTNDVNLE